MPFILPRSMMQVPVMCQKVRDQKKVEPCSKVDTGGGGGFRLLLFLHQEINENDARNN